MLMVGTCTFGRTTTTAGACIAGAALPPKMLRRVAGVTVTELIATPCFVCVIASMDFALSRLVNDASLALPVVLLPVTVVVVVSRPRQPAAAW